MAYSVLNQLDQPSRPAAEATTLPSDGRLADPGSRHWQHRPEAVQRGDLEEGGGSIGSQSTHATRGRPHGRCLASRPCGLRQAQRRQRPLLEQHLEASEIASQFGDPEMTGLEPLDVVVPLVELADGARPSSPGWKASPWSRPGIDGSRSRRQHFGSLLHAAGDVEGATETWAAANALASEHTQAASSRR